MVLTCSLLLSSSIKRPMFASSIKRPMFDRLIDEDPTSSHDGAQGVLACRLF